MSVTLTTRTDPKTAAEIDKIAQEEQTDRSTAIRKLIEIGLSVKTLEKALNLYAKRKITLWKAAEIADRSLWEMIEEIRQRRIVVYTEEEAREDLRAIFGG
ncbi:MAG: UPF0175 family protein [Candidatus Heimdallarchaeota archaeon]